MGREGFAGLPRCGFPEVEVELLGVASSLSCLSIARLGTHPPRVPAFASTRK